MSHSKYCISLTISICFMRYNFCHGVFVVHHPKNQCSGIVFSLEHYKSGFELDCKISKEYKFWKWNTISFTSVQWTTTGDQQVEWDCQWVWLTFLLTYTQTKHVNQIQRLAVVISISATDGYHHSNSIEFTVVSS